MRQDEKGKALIAVFATLAVLTGLACASAPSYNLKLEKPEGIFIVSVAGQGAEKIALPYDKISVSDKPIVLELLIPYNFYKDLFDKTELGIIDKRYGGEKLDLYATCTLSVSVPTSSSELSSMSIPVRLLLRTDDLFGAEARGTIEEAILSGVTTENYTYYHRVKEDTEGIKVVTAVINNVRKNK